MDYWVGRKKGLGRVVRLGIVFFASFALSFTCGSFGFITEESSAVSSSDEVDVRLAVSSVIDLALNTNSVNLNINPSSTGTIDTASVTASVSTNNIMGYYLTFSTLTNSTALTHINEINAVQSTIADPAAALPKDTWGHYTNHGLPPASPPETFLTIPPLSTPRTIRTSTTAVAAEQTTVTLGANISPATISGTYQNTLVFTATTNPAPVSVPTISSITPNRIKLGEATEVTITGTNLQTTNKILIGKNIPCETITPISATQVSCTVPSTLAEETFTITLTTYYGTSNSSSITIYEPLTPPEGLPPEGTYASTNPAALDVYPTTGWQDEIITIPANPLFTNIQSVTIGGTPCQAYEVLNTSTILCKLPSRPNGSKNDIAVMNGTAPGTNITPTTTYTHMNITYFDPENPNQDGYNQVPISQTNTDGTPYSNTFRYYPGGFTSANCSSLTPSNSTSMNLPNSIAYVRDTRNNQVYKVKRMIDNKCWMIDNLKFIGNPNAPTPSEGGITNIDSTKGIIYRNGRGPNNPSSGTGTYNTVDGSSTQSTTNSDKAFYNNPMSNTNCYSQTAQATYMSPNTLTHCGYLYNWYAATAGTGIYNESTNGNQVTGDICPANFRLPSGSSGIGGPTTNGAYITEADFPVLSGSMASGSLAGGTPTDNTSTQAGWQPSGAWSGTLSGAWLDAGLSYQGTHGHFWSSTASSATTVRILRFRSGDLSPGNGAELKRNGFAVRCLVQ